VLSLLRSRDFRLLWLGQSVSMIGDALVLVTTGLFVTRLTGSPSAVGIVLTAYALPLVAFVLIGGVVADRLPRRTVMIASDIVRAVLHGILALLIATGAVRIWHMVLIGLAYGTAEAFFRPAYTGLIPQTVPEDAIQSAQALGGISGEVAWLVSPALAATLVVTVGGAAAYGLDAVTFIVSALLLMPLTARERGGTADRSGLARELRAGWNAVRERSWVWATIAAYCVALLAALAPFFVLGPTIARDVYGTSGIFGVALAFWGLGTLTGALAGLRWRPRRPMVTGLLLGMWWPATIAVYAAGPPVTAMCVVMSIGGAGAGLFTVFWETALAERIPPHLLSRVASWDWLGSLALLPAGYLASGPLGSVLGVRTVVVTGGLLGTLALGLALLPSSGRMIVRMDLRHAVTE
jgi:predicted MFS family arabinose efflux permease